MTMAGQGAEATADGEVGADADAVRVLRGLEDGRASVRLRAALMVGSAPDPRIVGVLVERCAVESEFFVRDMLTWALTRHPVSLTLPPLLREVRSERAQARSQALHTLSKIGDRRAWPAITRGLLTDADDEVARSAWRAAVVLVPEGEEAGLAAVLATQLGRGERETQLSLSRALVALGEVVRPVLRAAATAATAAGAATGASAATATGAGTGTSAATATATPTPPPPPPAPAPAPATVSARRARAHALATERLLLDPDVGFEFAIEEAKRVVALDGDGRKGR